MADKKSGAAHALKGDHKKQAPGKARPHKHEASGKQARRAAPHAPARKGKAEPPKDKVKRGEKEKAAKGKEGAAKAAGEQEGEEVEAAAEEGGDLEAAIPEVTEDDEVPVAEDLEEDEDDRAPPKKGGKATDRKEVKDLLALGRDKGFLTYDEVNDALPSDIVSSDQIDDVMSMFGDNDIAIVDEANKVKLPETKPPEPEPTQAKAEEEAGDSSSQPVAREEEDDAYSKSNDPVRMYLRKMGSVSLLTREGEVEIAKRIEDGAKAETLSEVKLNKRQIERIIENLKKLIERVDQVERELRQIEHRAGIPLKELKALLRESEDEGKGGLAARRKLKQMGLTEEDIGEVARTIAAAPRKVKRVEEEALLPMDELKKSFHAIIAGERKA